MIHLKLKAVLVSAIAAASLAAPTAFAQESSATPVINSAMLVPQLLPSSGGAVQIFVYTTSHLSISSVRAVVEGPGGIIGDSFVSASCADSGSGPGSESGQQCLLSYSIYPEFSEGSYSVTDLTVSNSSGSSSYPYLGSLSFTKLSVDEVCDPRGSDDSYKDLPVDGPSFPPIDLPPTGAQSGN